jgi:diadenylate cyclase
MSDLFEVAILAFVIFVVLRLLGQTRGAGVVRGLGMVVVGLFLAAQVIVAILDLTVLGKALDYLLTTALLALVVIFHPELRRGLLVLGRYRILRYFVHDQQFSISDKLSDAAEAMSRECVGALIVIEREQSLTSFIETGERLDAEVSCNLLRSLFSKRSPLHDGAVILSSGRVAAAGCQLPLAPPPDGTTMHYGMRHRSAMCMSEETDAVLLVVSEETGRISLAVAGKLEPVPRENLPVRLAALLSSPSQAPRRESAERQRAPRSAA